MTNRKNISVSEFLELDIFFLLVMKFIRLDVTC